VLAITLRTVINMFVSLDAHDRPLAEGDRLLWHSHETIRAGSVELSLGKQATSLQVDCIGHLRTGDGRVLEDIVADLTIGTQRIGIRMYEEYGQGSRWIVVGAPYDEELAPLKHRDVRDARDRWTEADADLRYARARQREEPCPANAAKAKVALANWERALMKWAQKIEAHPDSDSRLQWREADQSRVPIPNLPLSQ
jgi:hypothetical protein